MKLNTKNKNILILDDDKITINMLTEVLKDEYNVFYSTKHNEAFKILERIKIDLILLDVIMPEISGFEFLDNVKKNEKLYNIPAIFITSKKDDTMLRKLDSISTSYIFKPFDTDILKTKINNLISNQNTNYIEDSFNKNFGNILIFDDEQLDIDIIRGSLNNKFNLFIALNYKKAIEILEENKIDLILLDVMMPEINGFEFCRNLKSNNKFKSISVIFLTVKDNTESTLEGFKSGGVDFITKPFNREELLLRINTHLEIKRLHDELKEKNKILEDRKLHLEYLVQEKTEKIEKITNAMVTALESANLYSDENTGNHIKRVTYYAVLIAKELKMPFDFINKIKIYASIHDIGKIGISHSILRKKGKLTNEEFEEMKKHVKIGYKILNDSEIDDVAKNIVLYHHEKWDGSGYLKGLKGEEIPLEARIVTIADVYDALTTERPYKPAFSHEKAEKIMIENKSKHFDPHLINLFFSKQEKILEIKNKFN